MNEIAEVLYHFFSLFNVFMAGIFLGRIMAGAEWKSKKPEKAASASATVFVFDLGSGLGGRPREEPAQPGTDSPNNNGKSDKDTDDAADDRHD